MDPGAPFDNARLARIAQRLQDLHEADLGRFAGVLHDEIGQMLTALKLILATPGLESGNADSADMLAEARSLTEELIRKVRDLQLDLRPAMLDDLGLADTLDWYLGRAAREQGWSLDMDLDGLDDRLPHRVETAAYRVIQEAVCNVAAHARASRVEIRTRRAGRDLSIHLRDDGVGFDAEAALRRARREGGSGLSVMEERVMLMGGTLEIQSAEGDGTRVSVVLPVATGED